MRLPLTLAIVLAWSSGASVHSQQAQPTVSGNGAEDEIISAAVVESNLSPRNVSATAERNEWNPRFSPNGRYLSFERRDETAQAIFILDMEAPDAPPERVSSMPPEPSASLEDMVLGIGRVDESFNTQLSFYPDGSRFVFTGNESSGVYRLYQGSFGGSPPVALTSESKEDGHPAVSPDGKWLAYVSAREGLGKLYLRDLLTGAETLLTAGPKIDLFPVWSPDGRALAYTSGDNDNHDVYILHDVTLPDPEPAQLTTWSFDDLRPKFSADGSSIAFYSSYNPEGEDKIWSIVVVPADGSGPAKGAALTELAVAVNVVKDPEMGPAWLPHANLIVYARNLKKEFNPIYVVDTETGEERRIHTGTRMNHDVTCSSQGVLAFRAQIATWDDIFIAPLVRLP